jgi:hypothetical protein
MKITVDERKLDTLLRIAVYQDECPFCSHCTMMCGTRDCYNKLKAWIIPTKERK